MRSQCSGYLEPRWEERCAVLAFFFFFFFQAVFSVSESYLCFQPVRMLLMFLSRLYVSGGCEKIAAVSGSFWSSLKFLEMMFLIARQKYK